jgi:hypothetical protein
MVDPADMTTPPLTSIRATALREILSTQRDAHTRRRELVRASLTMYPGKSRPASPAR